MQKNFQKLKKVKFYNFFFSKSHTKKCHLNKKNAKKWTQKYILWKYLRYKKHLLSCSLFLLSLSLSSCKPTPAWIF